MAMPYNGGLNWNHDLSGWVPMNLLLRILAVGSLLTATQIFAADAFEGKVSFAITSGKGQPQVMDYAMKGHKLRMDMTTEDDASSDRGSAKKKHKMIPNFLNKKKAQADEEPDQSSASDHASKGKKQMTSIMDMEKKEMIMLMPEQKTYMVMPMKQAMDKATEHTDKNMDIERTGKTEKILGYKCDQIIVKDKENGTVTEMWVAPNLGTFMGMSSGGGMFGGRKSATSAKWEEALKGKSGFPLRVVTRNATGAEDSRMEVTKIEPGSQPDSLFAPPADYEKFSMPSMGDLFKQR